MKLRRQRKGGGRCVCIFTKNFFLRAGEKKVEGDWWLWGRGGGGMSEGRMGGGVEQEGVGPPFSSILKR